MKNDTLHIEVTYAAPSSKVWKALTDAEEIRKWYFDISNIEPKEGFEFEFNKSGYKRDFLHRCKILKVEDGSCLKYSWAYPENMEGESVVSWELIPRGGATCVRLTHEGLSKHQAGGASFTLEKFEAGWNDILKKSLANYLEK